MTTTDPTLISQPFVIIKKVDARSASVASSTRMMATQHSAPTVGRAAGKFWSDKMKHVGELWPIPLTAIIW